MKLRILAVLIAIITLTGCGVTQVAVQSSLPKPKFIGVGSPGEFYGGETSPLIIASEDGYKWRPVYRQRDGSGAFYSTAYGNGTFVAIARSWIYYSHNGNNWNRVSVPSKARGIINAGVVFAEGVFFAAGANGSIIYSADGETWEVFTAPEAKLYSSHYNGVFYKNGIFYAVGTFERITMLKYTGMTFNIVANEQFSKSEEDVLTTMCSLSNSVVALGNNNVYTSPDGTIFSPVYKKLNIVDAVYAQNKITALNSYGRVYYSEDATNWESLAPREITEKAIITFSDISYSHGLYIASGKSEALGYDNYILVSSNGYKWQTVSLAASDLTEGVIISATTEIKD